MDDITMITQLIGSLGFPIVACGALFWMINTTIKSLQDTLSEINQTLPQILESLKHVCKYDPHSDDES